MIRRISPILTVAESGFITCFAGVPSPNPASLIMAANAAQPPKVYLVFGAVTFIHIYLLLLVQGLPSGYSTCIAIILSYTEASSGDVVALAVGLGVGVDDGFTVAVGVGDGFTTAVGVGDGFTVAVGVAAGVDVGFTVTIGVDDGFAVAVGVGDGLAVVIDVDVGPAVVSGKCVGREVTSTTSTSIINEYFFLPLIFFFSFNRAET